MRADESEPPRERLERFTGMELLARPDAGAYCVLDNVVDVERRRSAVLLIENGSVREVLHRVTEQLLVLIRRRRFFCESPQQIATLLSLEQNARANTRADRHRRDLQAVEPTTNERRKQ